MKVEIGKNLPRPYRDGMIASLTECLSMFCEDGLTGKQLYRRMAAQMRKLWPPEYAAYCERHLDAIPFVSIDDIGPVLQYKDWRARMAQLREGTRLCEMMGEEPGRELVHLRWKLLLSGLAWDKDGEAETPDTLLRDGEIDGYMECINLMDNDKLDAEQFADRICHRIFAVWPADYLDYRQRYNAFFKEMGAPKDIGPAMEFPAWREAVDKLHAEAERCQRSNVQPSKRHTRLCLLLLRVPGEREPIAD